MKKCTRCGLLKDEVEFSNNKRNPDGKSSWCKQCQSDANRERAASFKRFQKTKSAQKRAKLKSNYKMTLADYQAMYDKQGGKCAICGTPRFDLPRDLAVDHDHITGEVRGLLCYACNHGLADFRDDQRRLLNAVDYLRRGEPYDVKITYTVG